MKQTNVIQITHACRRSRNCYKKIIAAAKQIWSFVYWRLIAIPAIHWAHNTMRLACQLPWLFRINCSDINISCSCLKMFIVCTVVNLTVRPHHIISSIITKPCHIKWNAALCQIGAIYLNTLSRCFPRIRICRITITAKNNWFNMNPLCILTERSK